MKDSEKRNDPAVPAAGVGVSDDRGNGIGQLREILFGAAQRELERRISRSDAHLVSRAHDVEQESRRRLDVLEAHLVKETEALSARFEHEITERGDILRAMSREHRESNTAIEQRIAKVEDRMNHIQRELRQELLSQAKTFLDELHQLRREITQTLETELGLGAGSLEELSHGHGERSIS